MPVLAGRRRPETGLESLTQASELTAHEAEKDEEREVSPPPPSCWLPFFLIPGSFISAQFGLIPLSQLRRWVARNR